MDFDLDDPLGDLLSDGSNDSFFGTSSIKPATQKNQAKPALSGSDTKTKSKVANLFGIDADKASNEKPNEPIISKIDSNFTQKPTSNPSSAIVAGADVSKKPSTPKPSSRLVDAVIPEPMKRMDSTKSSKKEIKFDDSDDFLSELGFDPKKPKATLSTKKSNIIDDILGFGKAATEAPKTQGKIQPSSKTLTNEVENKRIVSTMESSSSGAINRYSPALGRPRSTPRTNSGSSQADPLGFFSMQSAQSIVTKKEETPPAAVANKSKLDKKPVAVDWLGLSTDNTLQPTALDQQAALPPPSTTSIAQSLNAAKDANVDNSTVTATPNTQLITNIESMAMPLNTAQPIRVFNANDMSQGIQLINIASAEKEQALHSLQQQETQLRIVTQMKQQENILLDMHNKQQALMKQQENQFNELLRRQLNRQTELEQHIQQQQEQINSYINVLMTQPSVGAFSTNSSNPLSRDGHETNNGGSSATMPQIQTIEMEAEVKRLELEKLRLEDVLQSIRTSHEQELDLLETSHKKQIKLLEENLENLEQRLRTEIKSIEDYYAQKLATLTADKDSLQQKYEEQIANLVAEHEKHLAKIRSNYENDIETLKNDQRMTIENVRQSKLMEFAVLQENGSYLSTLKNASNYLETASDNLQSLRTNIDTNIERLHTERESQLVAREKRLEDQQKNMDKMLENTESERLRLIELLRSLELKLNTIEQSSAEEQWTVRQQRASLDAERVSLEREKSFVREKQAAEEKRIQELKELQFSEHKRLMDIIDAERQQILVEKAKLETMERLKKPAPSHVAVQHPNEIDAAVKVAQEAAKQAENERERFVELQRQFETRQRKLIDKENAMRSKESELESKITDANKREREAEYATKACKILERKMSAKLQSLQSNYAELTEREAKLSQAKMELSKERMELQAMRRQLRQTRCSLCRVGEHTKEITDLLSQNDTDPLNGIGVTDKLRPSSQTPFYSTQFLEDIEFREKSIDELLAAETMADNLSIRLAQVQQRFPFEIDLAPVPNITDTSNSLLDPDLLLVKLDLLNARM